MEGADRPVDDRLARTGTKWRQSMKLDGFGLLVEDMGRMIRFYRDVLGFEIKEEENTSNVYLVKDGTPSIVNVPKMNYIAVRGSGNPNVKWNII